jgi:hypothetical protein
MIKVILVAGLLISTTFANAQSNTLGTIHVELDLPILLGGGDIKTNLPFFTDDAISRCAGFNPGLRVQFGIAKVLSAGAYIKRELAWYSSAWPDDYGSTFHRKLTAKGIGVGFETRFCFVNGDKLLMYLAPSVGYAASNDNDKFVYDESHHYSSRYTGGGNGNSSGIEFGLTFGFNWYWSTFLGMSFNGGLSHTSRKGEFDNIESQYSNYEIKGLGFVMGLGLVSKFGGSQ